MTPEQLKAALMASTEQERMYVLGPIIDLDMTGQFSVDEEDVDQAVDQAAEWGRLGQIRFRMYEFGLIRSALGF